MAKHSADRGGTRPQQERKAFSNLLQVVLLGLIAEAYLLIAYQGYINGTVKAFLTWYKILCTAVWLGLVLFAGGIGAAMWKKNDPKARRIALITAGAGAFFTGTSWVMTHFFETGAVTLCIIIPVLAVLGLVYYLYQRECFAVTTLLAGSLFTVWVCDKGIGGYWSTLVTFCAVLVAVGLLLLLPLLSVLQKRDGLLGRVQWLPEDCHYHLLRAVCILCAVVVAVAVAASSLSFYLTWVLVIALFAELTYYTAKMM